MINDLISTFLTNNKRIVIPGLGAFLRKSADQSIVFVQFLNQDDGVLSNLITQSLEVESPKAQQIIKEYVDAVKNTLSTKGEYAIDGVGVLKLDCNETIFLDTEIRKTEQPESTEKVQPATATSETISTPQIDILTEIKPEDKETDSENFEQYGGIFSAATPQTANEPDSDPAVEKTTENKSYNLDNKTNTNSARPKKKVDLFLVFAVVAAIVAILSIVYGYLADNQEITLPKNNIEQIEQPAENTQK